MPLIRDGAQTRYKRVMVTLKMDDNHWKTLMKINGDTELDRSAFEVYRKVAESGNRVLQIGGGVCGTYEALQMLLSNHKLTVDCVWLTGEASKAFMYLKRTFKSRVVFRDGREIEILASLQEQGMKYDIFHLLGMIHDSDVETAFRYAKSMATYKARVLWECDECLHLHDRYVESGVLRTWGDSEKVDVFVEKFEPSVAVCSLAVGGLYKNITKYATRTKEQYALRHGYSFFDHENLLDDSRPIPWSKIPLILEQLEKGYDYVFWVDGDAYIMDQTISVEELILTKTEGKDITIARDWVLPNTGVIIIKNTTWSRRFLETVWDQEQHINSPNWEQSAFLFLYDNNVSNAQEHVNIFPLDAQDVMNSYWYSYKYPTCFILHFAGCSSNIQGNLAHLMHKYCPIKRDDEEQADFERRVHWLRFESESDQNSRLGR